MAIDELRNNSGTQFAPDVVDSLIAVVARDTPDWELTMAAPTAAQITVSSAA